MDYVLIRGTFHVVGFSPDGDSVAFKADDDAQWNRIVASDGGKAVVPGRSRAGATPASPLPGALPSVNLSRFRRTLATNQGCAQLRLQGMDAPETHFVPSEGSKQDFIAVHPVGQFQQPGDFARRAADALLAGLGVTEPVWHAIGKAGEYLSAATVTLPGAPPVRVAKKFADRIPGYIVTREVEGNGRPVSWVFPGDPGLPDGATLGPDALAERVPDSLNYRQLAAGLVYPYFYATMENVLMQRLSEAVDLAVGVAKRSRAVKNLWSVDRTAKGVAVTDISAIVKQEGAGPDGALIWPYLFRKILKTWYQSTGASTTAVNLTQLYANGNPTVGVGGDHVKLDSVVAVAGGTLRLTTAPQNVVFPP